MRKSTLNFSSALRQTHIHHIREHYQQYPYNFPLFACFRIHCGAIFYVHRVFYVFMFALFSNLQMLIKWFLFFSFFVHWHKITVSFCGFWGFVFRDVRRSFDLPCNFHSTRLSIASNAKKGCVDLIMFSDCRHMLKLCHFNFVATKMIAWKHDIKIESIQKCNFPRCHYQVLFFSTGKTIFHKALLHHNETEWSL